MKRRSPATAIACLALFLSLGGVGLAASRYVITSTSQIKPSVLGDLRGHRGSQGLRGDSGHVGGVGPQGAQGTQGQAGSIGNGGAQGVQGVAGSAGSPGTAGSQGASGAAGTAASQVCHGASGAMGRRRHGNCRRFRVAGPAGLLAWHRHRAPLDHRHSRVAGRHGSCGSRCGRHRPPRESRGPAARFVKRVDHVDQWHLDPGRRRRRILLSKAESLGAWDLHDKW